MKGVLTWILFLYGQSVLCADVNILWINDPMNEVAKETIEIGLKNPPDGVNVANQEWIESDSMDKNELMKIFCTKYDAMIDKQTPPDLVVDSTRSGYLSDVVKKMTTKLGLPTISTSYGTSGDIKSWSNLNSDQMNFLVQIRPPGDVIINIIRQMIERQNITSAVILHDERFVMDYQYKHLLINVPTRHIIQKMKKSETELKDQLNKFAMRELNNFFIIGTTNQISQIMSFGKSMNLVGTKYAWYGLTLDTNTVLDCYGCHEEKIFMQPMPSKNNLVTDLRNMYGIESRPDIDVAFYFDTLHMGLKAVSSMKDAGTWPEIQYEKCNDNVDVIPRNLNLLRSLQSTNEFESFAPIQVSKNGHSSMIFGVNAYKMDFKNGALSSKKELGTWSVENPKEFNLKPGMTLGGIAAETIYKVVTVIQPPFVFKNDSAPSGYSGYVIDLLDALTELIHFKYTVYESPDGEYGRMQPDKSWTGVIKELIDGNADLAAGALSVMSERERVIEFTVPYYDLVGITIMMKKPKPETSLFKFLTVLENSVWFCILGAYFFTSILMWVFDKYSPYSFQNNMETFKDDDEQRYFNFKECLWFCMTSLTPQGGGEAPKNLSGRLVAATWWLFSFIIIASYTANLAAFLTVSRLETPVESLEDLASQYKIQYSTLNGSDAMIYFERMAYIEEKFYQVWKDMSLDDSGDPYERSKLAVWEYPVNDKYTKIWQSMKESGIVNSMEEAQKRVRDSISISEGYAFIGDATDIKYLELSNCDLQEVGDQFSKKPYALAVPQGSPLKDQLNDAILKLLNQRMLENLKEKWWAQNPNKATCEDDDSDTSGGISIYNIGGVFIVILVGIGIAFITLIVEFWYYKFKAPVSSNGDDFVKVKQAALKSSLKSDYGGFDTGNIPTVDS